MVEYWSISDIVKILLSKYELKVGTKFYCHSKVNPEIENYFVLTHVSETYVHWRITDHRNTKLDTYETVNQQGRSRMSIFIEGIKEGRYIML